MKFGLVGADLLAYGHPGPCGDPASGVVAGSSSISINGVDIAAKDESSMNFASHGHDVDDEGNCISFSSHNVQPDSSGLSGTVRIDGGPVYLAVSNAGTDPGTGGNIDYSNTGGNETVGAK